MTAPAIIDAHLHAWNPRELEYPWLASVPELNRQLVLDTDAIHAADVSGVVLVQADCRPSQAVQEAKWLLAHHADTARGVVAFVPVESPAERDQALDELDELTGVVGVRRTFHSAPTELLSSREAADGIARVGDHSLTFDACVSWQQLPALVRTLRGVPDTKIVLDHLGNPPYSIGLGSSAGASWRSAMRELAANERTTVKISGLPGATSSHETTNPFVIEVLELFGADRCMIGSDWPVSGLKAGTYGDWFPTLLRGAGLNSAEVAALAHATAKHTYDL